MPTTHPSQPTRLPTSSRAHRRGGEVLRGLLGLIALLAVAVGIPVALVILVGNPLPDEAPNSDWLTAEISSDTVLDVLAMVMWLAWLHFVVCLVVELVSDRRGRGLAPSVPGGRVGTQALARRLVGAVVLLAGTTAATLPVASASADRTPERVTAVAEATESPTPSSVDPSTSAIRAADGVVKYYEVQPPSGRNYDTLWDIAERFLGSGLRYREIFELNHGVLQPDGRKLIDADLVQPGWLLQLPGDAEGPGLKVVDHRVSTDAPSVAPESDDGVDDETHADSRASTDGDEERAKPETTARDLADDADPPSWPIEPVPAEPAAAEVAPEDDSAAAEDHDDVWAPTFGIAGGLLAAGLLAGLRRRRIAGDQLFLRAPNPDGGPTGPPGLTIADHESALRWESDPTSADLLNRGLRVWPPALYGAPVPRPTHCVLTADGVSAVFAEPPGVAAPPPWRSSEDGRVWTLWHHDHRRLNGGPPALVPYPALVAFGRQTDDTLLLMDLEAFPGVVSIGGDVDVARSIAISWAVDLAVHAWADERRVWLVGFADAPTEIAGPAMRVVDEIDRVLESLDRAAERQRVECGRLGVDSVAAGRVAEPDPRMWASGLVVCSGAPDADTMTRLQELAARHEHAISVVVVGDSPLAAARLAASPEGRLWSGPMGIDVVAQRLSVEAYRGLVDVFGDADAPRAEPATDGLAALTGLDLDASVFDPSSRQAVEIGILGPVAVEADGPVEEVRRELLTELVVYVALHAEGVHPNALTAALWPRGVSDDVVDSTLAAAQTWLDTDESGEPRLAMVDGRWTVRRSGVRFDWDVFKTLVEAADAQDADEVAVLGQALDLVRGEPWSQLPARSYGWLAYDTVDDDARVAIVLAARRLADACARRDDGRGARDAILRGLRVAPAAEELWRDALRLAARLGSRSDVRAVADEMYAAIERFGSPAGATAETDALVEELLPGYRPHSAA